MPAPEEKETRELNYLTCQVGLRMLFEDALAGDEEAKRLLGEVFEDIGKALDKLAAEGWQPKI